LIGKLIRKDLLRRRRAPAGFIALVCLPLLNAILMSAVFSPSSGEAEWPKVELLIADNDNSLGSQLLSGAFGRGQLAELFDAEAVSEETGRDRLARDMASALLIIPDGFGGDLLEGDSTELVLVVNPSQAFAPKIAEETVRFLAEGGDRLLRIGTVPISMIRDQINRGSDMSDGQIAAVSIQVRDLVRKVEKQFFPPLIELAEESVIPQQSQRPGGERLFLSILCGISVFTLFFVIEIMARDFFREAENQVLSRLLAAPPGVYSFVIAKLGFIFIAGLLAHILVWGIAVLFFGVRLSPAGWGLFALLSIGVIFAFTGIIALLYAVVRSRNQALAVAPAVIIFLSMVGGAMVPLSSLPPFMQRIALVSPVHWGVDGLKDIFFFDSSFSSLALHFVLLYGLGLLFSSAALMTFTRRYRP